MNNTIIIIPTLNEENNVEIVIDKILKTKEKFDILFIDDGSTDNTRESIEQLKNKYPFVNYIFRDNKTGIGSAHKTGLIYCYERKYEFIITMDADGTHDPDNISDMQFLMNEKKLDLVSTSRFKTEDSLKDWPIFRKFLTYSRHYLIKIFLNLHFDASGAFRIYNTKTINLDHILEAKDNRYAFFWESLFILKIKNYKINEININLPFRKLGKSKMKIRDVIKSIIYLFIVFFKYRIIKK